jgi:hypothetical protein
MSKEKYKPKQVITLLRQIEVAIANGKTAPQGCKEAEIHTQTCYPGGRSTGAKGAAGETAEGTREGEQSAETRGGGVIAGETGTSGRGAGKLLSPKRRRCAVERAERDAGAS